MSYEKPLVDDLADVLARMVVGWESQLGFDLSQHPDIQRVMARYRSEEIPTADELRYTLAWFDKQTLREFKNDPQGAVIFAKSQEKDDRSDL